MQDIDDILLKYFSNEELEDTEKIFLKNWKKESKENEDIYEELEKYWKHKSYSNNDVKERIWRNLNKNISVKNDSNISKRNTGKTKSNFNYTLLVAASFTLLIGFFLSTELRQQNNSIQKTEIAIVNGENKKGEKRSFKLSDGTTIKLNSESKISFPERFTSKTREVYLEGEAFFDVEKDSLRPFIIHSSAITTTVKGTSFNIKAYKNEEDISVSVMTGLVEVTNNTGKKRIELRPEEKAVFNNKDKTLIKKDFDLDEVSWKDGVLTFKEENLKGIIKKLERWYGVEFMVQDQKLFSKKGYSGSFKNENLKVVLETISFAGGFNFEIVDNKVIIIE